MCRRRGRPRQRPELALVMRVWASVPVKAGLRLRATAAAFHWPLATLVRRMIFERLPHYEKQARLMAQL